MTQTDGGLTPFEMMRIEISKRRAILSTEHAVVAEADLVPGGGIPSSAASARDRDPLVEIFVLADLTSRALQAYREEQPRSRVWQSGEGQVLLTAEAASTTIAQYLGQVIADSESLGEQIPDGWFEYAEGE